MSNQEKDNKHTVTANKEDPRHIYEAASFLRDIQKVTVKLHWLEKRVKELERDERRMTWLECRGSTVLEYAGFYDKYWIIDPKYMLYHQAETLREAIDLAMKADSENG